MRDYGVVRVRFWEWAKRKKLSLEARQLALYLLTSPHGNSLGCFRLPIAYLCDDLDAAPKVLAKTLEELQRVGFIHLDEEGSAWVWIVDYLEHNPVPNGNVGKAIGRMLEQVPAVVSFYADLLASLHGLPHFPPNLIDTLRERYLNGSDRVSRGTETHTQTHDHEQEHDQTHEHEQGSGAVAPAPPLGDAVAAYNSAAELSGWPRVQRLTSTRKASLTHRLDEAGGLEGWQCAMAKAAASKFLTGKTPRTNGHANWRPDFDWFVTASNFTKLMEGSYDNRNGSHDVDRGIGAVLAALADGNP